MTAAKRLFFFVADWLDTGVALLILAAGILLAVVLAFDGGTFVEVGLVLILLASVSLRWAMEGNAWRPLWRGRRTPRDEEPQ